MTQKRTILIIGISLLITGLWSCKKNPKEFRFQPDTASYFAFGNGTTWIYRNAGDTNDWDTVSSYASATGLADRNEGVAEVASVSMNGSSSERMVIRAEAIPTQNVDRIAVLTINNGLFEPGPILLNLNGNINPEDSSVVTKLLTFEAGGVAYQDIWEVSLKNHPVFNKLWFARNRGIIKKVLVSNDTFDLVEFSTAP